MGAGEPQVEQKRVTYPESVRYSEIASSPEIQRNCFFSQLAAVTNAEPRDFRHFEQWQNQMIEVFPSIV
jgi:hypothetical protein